MNIELEIQNIKKQLNNLQQSFLDSQKNQSIIVNKIDGTANKTDALTPYTETKTAYIGNTKVVFENVPDGNLTVYFNDSYKINRDSTTKRLVITFEPLKKVTDITISIL